MDMLSRDQAVVDTERLIPAAAAWARRCWHSWRRYERAAAVLHAQGIPRSAAGNPLAADAPWKREDLHRLGQDDCERLGGIFFFRILFFNVRASCSAMCLCSPLQCRLCCHISCAAGLLPGQAIAQGFWNLAAALLRPHARSRHCRHLRCLRGQAACGAYACTTAAGGTRRRRSCAWHPSNCKGIMPDAALCLAAVRADQRPVAGGGGAGAGHQAAGPHGQAARLAAANLRLLRSGEETQVQILWVFSGAGVRACKGTKGQTQQRTARA